MHQEMYRNGDVNCQFYDRSDAGCKTRQAIKGKCIVAYHGFICYCREEIVDIPKDYIENGAGMRGFIYCAFRGATSEEVIKKKRDYFAQYPPQGYDTFVSKNLYKHPSGYYEIGISRAASCD